MSTYYLEDDRCTEKFGACLAKTLTTGGLVIYLHGDLGSGKTTLSRGFIRGLGHTGAVKSPTYTLVEPYENFDFPLYHFDLYRLTCPEEVEFLGVDDYFRPPAVCLIEWPQRGVGFLPAADLRIYLTSFGRGRQLKVAADTATGRRAMAQMQVLTKNNEMCHAGIQVSDQ